MPNESNLAANKACWKGEEPRHITHMETRRAMAEATIVAPLKTKRVNLNLAVKSFQDLEHLAEKTGRTMSDVVRLGLALVKMYVEEEDKGNKLIIASPKGKVISEIRFP